MAKLLDLKTIQLAVNQFAVQCRDKTLRSSTGHEYILPSQHLADLLRFELQGTIKTHRLVLETVSRSISIDSDVNSKTDCINELEKYYSTDTCLFRDHSDGKCQEWDKCVGLFTNDTKIKPTVCHGLCAKNDSRIDSHLQNLNGWRLAALEVSARHCKSFIIPWLWLRGLINVEEAVKSALLEQEKQAEKWGELEEHRLERARLFMVLYFSKLMIL